MLTNTLAQPPPPAGGRQRLPIVLLPRTRGHGRGDHANPVLALGGERRARIPENRLLIHDELGNRQRFSPTHLQVAVCCNPNATRLAPSYIAHSWMRPPGPEPALAATLYGPCEVRAELAGTTVRIEEMTGYPYSGDVEIQIHPASPVSFCLWLRNPEWSRETKVVCPGAEIRRSGGFWQVRKEWQAGDTVVLHFDQSIREVPAINGEAALQYGPLLYVLPVKSETQTVKTYANSAFKDYYALPTGGYIQ